MLNSGKTIVLRCILSPDHCDIAGRSCGTCSVLFFADMTDPDTAAFFNLSGNKDGLGRYKVHKSMMAMPYSLYFGMGMAESGDIYDNIEAPLQGVIRSLLFGLTHELSGSIKGEAVNFNVRADHVGNGSLTADEKARIHALNRSGGDVFSLANVHRYIMGGYMSYYHLATTAILDWSTIWEMGNEWEKMGDDQDDADKVADVLHATLGSTGSATSSPRRCPTSERWSGCSAR